MTDKQVKKETVTTESIVYQRVDNNWLEQSKKVDVTTVEREFEE